MHVFVGFAEVFFFAYNTPFSIQDNKMGMDVSKNTKSVKTELRVLCDAHEACIKYNARIYLFGNHAKSSCSNFTLSRQSFLTSRLLCIFPIYMENSLSFHKPCYMLHKRQAYSSCFHSLIIFSYRRSHFFIFIIHCRMQFLKHLQTGHMYRVIFLCFVQPISLIKDRFLIFMMFPLGMMKA